MVSLKQEFEFYDYFGPVAVISLFAVTVLLISFFILNFFFISKYDEPTVFERVMILAVYVSEAASVFQIASKHNLRLGPHSVKTVISRKQRYMKDGNSGNPDGSVNEPRKVVFTKQPEPEILLLPFI
uniref:Neur_chan_memb domain-containing protein n=1 Tax=Elaeophora elaphi TaxID=1147741 RepID=A0A0R3S551_9BILA